MHLDCDLPMLERYFSAVSGYYGRALSHAAEDFQVFRVLVFFFIELVCVALSGLAQRGNVLVFGFFA